MRTFTVTAHSVIVGFRVHRDPYPHVRMGTTEDHQTALWIPLREWPEPIPTKITRCSTKFIAARKKNRDKPTLLLVPERKTDKPDNALVLVDIRGKEGGEAAFTTARTATRFCPLRGSNSGEYDVCPVCATEYSLGRHPNVGTYEDYGEFPPHLVTIVRKGWIRHESTHPKFPNTQRPPWAPVFLLQMQPKGNFRVHRGYDKGRANERFVRWTGDHIELGSKSEMHEERLVLPEYDEDADAAHDIVFEHEAPLPR